jgi:transposase
MDEDRTAPARWCARQAPGRRPTGHQRHTPCIEDRLPLVRLPTGIRSVHHGLQPVRALGEAQDLGANVRGPGEPRPFSCHAVDRFHPCEGASFGRGWKGGEQNQAIGRSRGGRNTKIHAVADAKGRLLTLMLTDGAAHDCPVARSVIERCRPAKKMLGDKAYDSAELRAWLKERGTKAVIPNRSNRSRKYSFSKAAYRAPWHRKRILPIEGLSACVHALRQTGQELPGLRLSRRSDRVVGVMSLDPS